MKISVMAVGACKVGIHHDLWNYYWRRLHPQPSFTEIDDDLPSVLKAVQKVEFLVALDEHGEMLTSQGLADLISFHQVQSTSSLGFIIGGSHGLHPDVLKLARLKIAFGKVTWPHLLMRGLLAEQLYRAQQIIANHPYHHK